nr:uncharacterized protein LOC118055913 [Populus alba]
MKSAPMNAERLAELAVDLGFDGWLINMEVSLHKQQIPNLEEFVSHLTHAMHSLMPESLVIGSRLSCFCRGQPANRCSLEQHVLPRLSDDSNAPFSVRFSFKESFFWTTYLSTLHTLCGHLN